MAGGKRAFVVKCDYLIIRTDKILESSIDTQISNIMQR
jgi:hypothetical protein